MICDFPREAFPKEFREMLSSLSKSMGVEDDYAFCVFLSIMMFVTGRSFRAKIKNTWKENPIMYLCLVGVPGAKKSPVLSFFTSLIEEWQQELYDGRIDELLDEDADIPILMTNNYTIEAIMEVFLDNKHSLFLNVDEFKAFISSLNQYKSGGTDRQIMLSLYNGETITLIRKSDKEPKVPRKCFIVVCGGMQPDVLKEVFTNSNDGMMERVMFCFPDSKVSRMNMFEVDEKVLRDFKRTLTDLFHSFFDISLQGENRVLPLSSEAIEYYTNWVNKNADEVDNNSIPTFMHTHIPKLDAMAVRIALVFSLIREESISKLPMEITLQNLIGGIKVAEYFKACAMKVHEYISSEDQTAKMEKIVGWIEKRPAKVATARDLYSYKVAGIRNARDAEDAMVLLEKFKYGCIEKTRNRNDTGKHILKFRLFKKDSSLKAT